jgi:hypothetical protein
MSTQRIKRRWREIKQLEVLSGSKEILNSNYNLRLLILRLLNDLANLLNYYEINTLLHELKLRPQTLRKLLTPEEVLEPEHLLEIEKKLKDYISSIKEKIESVENVIDSLFNSDMSDDAKNVYNFLLKNPRSTLNDISLGLEISSEYVYTILQQFMFEGKIVKYVNKEEPPEYEVYNGKTTG